MTGIRARAATISLLLCEQDERGAVNGDAGHRGVTEID